VVLVPVREDERRQPLGALAHVREVRQHEVDAVHLRGGEAHARVHDHERVALLDHRHVLADLAEAAERQHA
jgi:hypothetical protein